MLKLIKLIIRKVFSLVVTLVVLPVGIILYVILESLRVAKQIEIKVDKLKKGK
jgi:hypothetical protein